MPFALIGDAPILCSADLVHHRPHHKRCSLLKKVVKEIVSAVPNNKILFWQVSLAIRYRPMRLKDIPECAKIVAAHPTLGPRYGTEIANVSAFWRRLIANEWYFTNALFEEVEGASVRVLGVGLCVFVSDDFLQEAKNPPSFWFGPEITRRVTLGYSPLLTEKQVAEANSRQGLNLPVLQTGLNPEYFTRPEATAINATAFVEGQRGYRLKETFAQGETPEHLAAMLNFGALLFNYTEGCYLDSPEENLDRIFAQPHLAGLTRETATRQKGSWLGSLFLYQPPRLGFSRSEQQLLFAAMTGKADDELTDSLGVSLSAVKKAWRAIYLRVTDRMPELIPNQLSDDGSTQNRGKEKKRRLLAYLREHPEELRPISRKLLQGHSVAPGSVPNRNSPARPASRVR